MSSFKDRSFCASSGECAAECHRRLTPELRAEAQAWVAGGPIAFAPYRDGPECAGFVAAEGEACDV